MKRIRALGALLCALLLLTGCTPGSSPSDSLSRPAPPEVREEAAPFEVRMLDVGQGECLLLVSDGDYLLYDGGGRAYSSYVVSYLRQHGIRHLDYLFVSHYDEDHINGLVGVLNTTEVDTAVTPDYRADSKIYTSFQKMLKQNGAKTVHPALGDTYTLGGADIQVVSPKSYRCKAENDRSIAIRAQYGAFSCIITGDAEAAAEQDMLDSDLELDSDLYVAGHHGSSSSSTPDFVRAVSPDYAFLCVGRGNSYGHPTQKTLTTLRDNQVQIFRTDLQGEVTACSDGDRCWFSTAPCSDWSPGAQGDEDLLPASEAQRATTYILNERSHIFHNPDCPGAAQMKLSNQKRSRASRKNLISRGYRPCQICQP